MQLLLKEAYRRVTVKEGDTVIRIPALQAVARSQIALAAKGNGPAQRAVIKTIQEIEAALQSRAQLSHEEWLDLLDEPDPEDATPSIVVNFVKPDATRTDK